MLRDLMYLYKIPKRPFYLDIELVYNWFMFSLLFV
jgi:hypothetical protein